MSASNTTKSSSRAAPKAPVANGKAKATETATNNTNPASHLSGGRKTRSVTQRLQQADVSSNDQAASNNQVPSFVHAAATKATSTKQAGKKTSESATIVAETTIIYSSLMTAKILVSSSAQGQRKIQAALDKDLVEHEKSERAKLPKWGTQIEAADASTMSSDFSKMGYSSEEGQEMRARPEPLKVDGLMQRFVPGGSHVEGTGLPAQKKNAAPKPKKGYQDLLVYKDKNWIPFDPLKPLPVELTSPPVAITRWTTYVTGNPRIVLQNKQTKSLRSQATPHQMLDETVEYTALGPMITNWRPITDPDMPPKPAKPESEPEPEPEQQWRQNDQVPLLGRGARRNVNPKVLFGDEIASLPARESKKRRADAISTTDDTTGLSTEPQATVPAASPKRHKTASPTPPPTSAPLAPETVAPSVAGDGVPKRKRKPARPKMTPAKVDNSSSE